MAEAFAFLHSQPHIGFTLSLLGRARMVLWTVETALLGPHRHYNQWRQRPEEWRAAG